MGADSTKSFAELNRQSKRVMNTPSKFVVDRLVEKTVSSLGGSSFVFDTSINTVEHRFLQNCRVLDIDERAYFNDKKVNPRHYAKLEGIPYGILF